VWYDSHCHLSAGRFDEDRAEVLARARAAGLELLIDIGCDPDAWEPSLSFAEAEPDVRCALGLHPHDARLWDDALEARLRALLTGSPAVCAIGEMGLDYHYDNSPRETQRAVFDRQLGIAEELDRPAVLHIRDAHEEAAALLAAHPRAHGVVHCFTGGVTDAERYLALGWDISFSGIVTFRKATEIQEAAASVPLDRILVETDAPYLAPTPKRGHRNEPAFVCHTGAFLAELRGLEEAEFAAMTRANTRRAFGIEER